LQNFVSGGDGAIQRQMLVRARGILLDWDGCVAIENRIIPQAIDLILRHLDKVAIVSNNSSALPSDFVEILEQQGIRLEIDRIILAGAESLKAISLEKSPRVFLIASERMRDYAQNLGIILDDKYPNIVLLMRDHKFSYEKLEIAANALRAGARLVVANADLSHPGVDRRIVPETGALLAALMACTGNPDMGWQLIGKPSPNLFSKACMALGVEANDAVMIGDNPQTDGEGAALAGIPAILIGQHSGLTLADLIEPSAASGEVQP
jgi:HAD superfamily hydrolase (TIGR01450 family)